MRILSTLAIMLTIVAAALFVRYGSADPCAWLRHDVQAYARDRAGPLGAAGAALVQELGPSAREPRACLRRWVRFHTADDDAKLDAVLAPRERR